MTTIRLALLVPLLLAGCDSRAERAASEADAEAPAAVAAPAEQPVYVDVRSPEEFATGHVAGAINIPHDQMEARWGELAAYRDEPLVVYCRSGRRSGLAIDVLRSRGFSRLENGGGFEELAAAGVPAER